MPEEAVLTMEPGAEGLEPMGLEVDLIFFNHSSAIFFAEASKSGRFLSVS